MWKKINIVDYGESYGPGRVSAKYDHGKPDEEFLSKSFDTLEDALAWVSRIAAEDGTTTPTANAHVAEPFREILNNWEGRANHEKVYNSSSHHRQQY